MKKFGKRLVLAAVLGSCLFVPAAAHAEEDPKISLHAEGPVDSNPEPGVSLHTEAPEYEMKEVTAHLYEMDKTTKLKVLFTKELPSVPYIEVGDYLENIFTSDCAYTSSKKDGLITLSGKPGNIIVDPEKDTLLFEDYVKMLNGEDWIYRKADLRQAQSYFIQGKRVVVEEKTKDTILDYAPYDIDILEVDGKAYIPLPTISDIFASSYNCAEYANGEIYFTFSMESTYTGSKADSYFDRASLYDDLDRDETLIDYTYNEMCFVFDHFYGFPTKAAISKSIREKGFDRAIEDFSSETREAKELLHSRSLVDYEKGLLKLQSALNDGGHTVTCYELISEVLNERKDSRLYAAFADNFANIQTDPLVSPAIQMSLDRSMAKLVFMATREKAAANMTLVNGGEGKWNETTFLYRKGDTALFVFDSFVPVVVPWFKWSLDWAEQNGIRNFIVDLSTNGGGDSSVLSYMICIMSNKDRSSNVYGIKTRNTLTGEVDRFDSELDLNLDGVVNDEDKKVGYDMNFAVLSSPVGFSCGNLMPFAAQEKGIMVMGSQSGGGACSITKCYTPDAHYYALSSNNYFVVDNGDDVDQGVKVDVELSRKDAEGKLDVSGFYDLDDLGRKMDAFYGKQQKYASEWADGKWYNKDGSQTYKGNGMWSRNAKGWTFIDSKGWMAKNQWQKIDGKWYFFDKEGLMQTGWKKLGGKWYYFAKNGAMTTGWQKISGKWYYFKASGAMAAKEYCQGYWINADGSWTYKPKAVWKKDSRGWYFIDTTGWYAKSASYTINGKKYDFNNKGYCTNP